MNKETKEEAFYTIIPNRKRCADCVFFQQVPGSVDMDGVCEKVVGIIKREAHCDNWQYANGLWPYSGRYNGGKT